ncbi:MAG: DUF1858 domain-containing protein [Clostridia bacterium]|nr:DUF1858 domain-containing protein [Clostridia bacterium]
MKKMYVDKDMLIGDIVNTYPESAEVLMEIGMHCLGCPASQAETLKDACAVHEADVDNVINLLNEKIAENRE